MKIIKYFLISIVLLLIVFFAMGIFKPTVKYGHTIEVDKPVKEAWAVSQDESKYDQWLAGFKSIELISGEKGEVGSKYKVIVNPGDGQEDFEMIETLLSIEEYDHVEMKFNNEMMDFYQKMTFSESDGKTIIKTDSKVMGKGLVTRSLFGWMETLTNSFDKQETKNMEALKKLIEN